MILQFADSDHRNEGARICWKHRSQRRQSARVRKKKGGGRSPETNYPPAVTRRDSIKLTASAGAALLLGGKAAQAAPYTTAGGAFAAIGFSPSAPGSAHVVIFADIHLDCRAYIWLRSSAVHISHKVLKCRINLPSSAQIMDQL